MALGGTSQAHRTFEVPQTLTKPDLGRLLPRSVDQWLALNKELFLGAKVALAPTPDASDIELRAFQAFAQWLRFHKPHFDRRDTSPWIDKARALKMRQNQS